MIIYILIMVATVLADQISKLLVVNFLSRDASFPIIKGIFQLTYVENQGAAFGSLSNSRWIFMIASTVMIIGLLIYLFRFPPKSTLACSSIALIIGGGIGNMIDRVRLGYVVDFFDFCAFPDLWKWVFNVADAAVCVGCGLLVLWCIVSSVKEYKADKAAKSASAASAEDEKKEDK